ncbi:hypothetical protein TKK_0011863 [Trichogramma kaykai]|uniref:Protein tincar n=1 Tax=Trichogramma kaykai TaxID=54128 RepID=A0ABD2WQ50_9HYME
MSMGGSLMGYNENNNDMMASQAKAAKSKGLKPLLPVATSVNAAGITSTAAAASSLANGNAAGARSARTRAKARADASAAHAAAQRKRNSAGGCGRGHVNSLWSVWYGIIAVVFQSYIAYRCTKRFIAYLSLPWPADAPPPKIELYACLALAGAGVLMLPILLAAAFLKLGNLANDGIKLGKHLTTCTRDPPATLINAGADSGVASSLWRHGGPTSAFIHLCTAMCFLLPSLLMEARLIHAGFLPKDAIWRTDLDWVVTHRERLVVLSFMNIPENASVYGYYNPTTQQSAYPAYPEDEFGIAEQLNASTSSSEESSLSPTKLSSALLPELVRRTSPNEDESDAGVDGWSSASTSTSTTRKPSPRMNARNVQQQQQQQQNQGQQQQQRHYRPKSKKNSAIARPRTSKSGRESSNGRGGGGGHNAGNWSAQSLPLSMSSLADLDHPESLNQDIDESEDYGPITFEYLNYALALGVYSVRYPAVFWATNKPLGVIFSFQLVCNAAQSLLAYAGMSVLYKVQVVGPMKALPLMRHRQVTTLTNGTLTGTGSTLANLLGDRIFLLNPHVTLGIFIMSSLLVLCSSMVMYLYAYGRFTMFLNQERERRIILSKDTRADDTGWTYITHPAAVCLFLAISICNAPLLYDYTVVYRGSLDGAVLACICATILHLALWLVLWLGLSVKRHWTFKLRITIGRATVRSTRSIRLVTDVDLMNSKDDSGEDASSPNAPLLVLGNGRTYTVAETSPKKAIMGVIQKAAIDRRSRSQGNSIDALDGDAAGDGDEQIYWLRPKLRPLPVQAGDKKPKQKVTFNDLPSTSRSKGKSRDGTIDDGDYATLRELPLASGHDEDNTSEENKLLECVSDDHVTYYASGNRDLQPSSEGENSPLDALPDPPAPHQVEAMVAQDHHQPLPLPPPTPTKDTVVLHANSQPSGLTPRCLRRADSGMPADGPLTPRSDSSHSPPLDPTTASSNAISAASSNNSETSSSGIHSSASSQRRATSVEDLTNEPREEPHWRSCSLQRGTQPPTSSNSSSPAKMSNPGRVIANPNATYASNAAYANHQPIYNGETTIVAAGVAATPPPSVILETEATVVIRRKNSRPKIQEPGGLNEEPFGRSTNMRMTSFTEATDLRAVQSSSATLPHYPTQPTVTYPHCSTMPLPHASHSYVATNGMSGSCGSVQPRNSPQSALQPITQQIGQATVTAPLQVVTNGVAAHTTLPSHHNGIRLMLHGGPNPFVKRFPPVQSNGQQPWAAVLPSAHHLGGGPAAHHTFPQLPATTTVATAQAGIAAVQQQQQQQQLPQINGKGPQPMYNGHQQQQLLQQQQQAQPRQSDRDSANFSMASSGDSDTCLPH